jgi:hypothetical protein
MRAAIIAIALSQFPLPNHLARRKTASAKPPVHHHSA